MNTVGIDVDSKNLVCRIRRNGNDFPEATFPNTATGHHSLIGWATRGKKSARVCIEATGVYSLPLALALHVSSLIEVMVVNPRAIKHFANAALQRGKTDSMDTATILEYLERMPFVPWAPPTEELLEIQYICRRIVALNNELVQERNRLHGANRLGRWNRKVVSDIEVNIRHLGRRITHLEKTVRDCVESVDELAAKLELLESTTGIARKTGPRILAELETLPDDMTGAQWVAHAGLDPRPHESGT